MLTVLFVKLLLSVHIISIPYNHVPVYSLTSFEATYVGCTYG